jgi:hypothetical protein
MAGQGMEGYRFTVTGYRGFEAEILRLRNANRSRAQSASYLDWRYASQDGTPEPKIFWMNDRDGRSCGMAALIFRRFWLNNALQSVAVLGDISLNADLRGRGLGDSLLKFVAADLDRNHPDSLGFVMPNEVAQRSLASAGWTVGGTLRPYVFLLNPEQKLRRFTERSWLARALAGGAARILTGIARMHLKKDYSLEVVEDLDNALDVLWQRFDKARLALSDRGREVLRWRYIDHPQYRFKLAKLNRLGQPAGYLVYRVSDAERECSIYDLLLSRDSDLGCMLALLVEHMSKEGGTDILRLMLNNDHPYGNQLWKLGFIPRSPWGVFQLYGRTAQARLAASRWFLTYGDKDI